MKTIYQALIVIMSLLVPVWSQPDSLASPSGASYQESEITALREKIDSLEAQFEELKIRVTETSPFITARYLKWGQGITLACSKSEYRITGEVGYTFLTDASWRMGIYLGGGGQLGADTDLPTADLYGKVSLGTPVLLNLISINGYCKTMYFPESNFQSPYDTHAGLAAGVDLEFWFRPNFCYTLGGSITASQTRANPNPRKLSEVNFFGLKYYPKLPRRG